MPFAHELNQPGFDTATIIRKSEFAGLGAGIQALGLLCFLAFPIGIIPGLLLLIIGGRLALTYRCSNCRNKVEKQSRLCPHCKKKLQY